MPRCPGSPRSCSSDSPGRPPLALDDPRHGRGDAVRRLPDRPGDPHADRLHQARSRPLGVQHRPDRRVVRARPHRRRLCGRRRRRSAGRAAHAARGWSRDRGIVLLAAAAPLPLLVPLLVLAGATGASSTPAGGRLVLLAFPRNRRGFALGIRQTGIPVAGLITALALPWIAHFSSWRWSIAVAAGVTALTALPLLSLRAEPRPPRPARPPPPRRPRSRPAPADRLGVPDRDRPVRADHVPRARPQPERRPHARRGIDPRRRRQRRRDHRPRRLGARQRPAARRQPQGLPAHDQRGRPDRRAAAVRRAALRAARVLVASSRSPGSR